MPREVLPPLLPNDMTRVDPNVMILVQQAIDSERYHTLAVLLKETQMLEQTLSRIRRSKSKDAAAQSIAVDAQISELKLLISQFVNRDNDPGVAKLSRNALG